MNVQVMTESQPNGVSTDYMPGTVMPLTGMTCFILTAICESDTGIIPTLQRGRLRPRWPKQLDEVTHLKRSQTRLQRLCTYPLSSSSCLRDSSVTLTLALNVFCLFSTGFPPSTGCLRPAQSVGKECFLASSVKIASKWLHREAFAGGLMSARAVLAFEIAHRSLVS